MSAEDYIFEDPIESYERSYEDGSSNYGSYHGYKTHAKYYEPAERICTKCEHQFSSKIVQACPECGGWTEEE